MFLGTSGPPMAVWLPMAKRRLHRTVLDWFEPFSRADWITTYVPQTRRMKCWDGSSKKRRFRTLP